MPEQSKFENMDLFASLEAIMKSSLDLFECVHDVVVGDIERAQRLGGNALVLLGEREQQMLGTHLI